MSAPPVASSGTRPTSYAAAAALAGGAALLLVACLLAPGFGLYATEAVALVTALVGAGVAMFLAVLGDATALRGGLAQLARVLVVVAFAASLLSVAFDVVAVAGVGLTGLGDATARSVVLRGGDYQSALARCVGVCVIAYAVTSTRTARRARPALLAGAVLTCASFVLMGHVRTHHPVALVATLALAHVLAVSAWAGGLVGLAWTLRRPRPDRVQQARLLSSFAALMTGVVVMLLAGGVGLSLVYLPSWHALLSTAYGQVLLVKLAVVAGALVVSAGNHRRIVPAATAGNDTALRVLRVNVAVEQVALLTVLVITEVLMRQSPVA